MKYFAIQIILAVLIYSCNESTSKVAVDQNGDFGLVYSEASLNRETDSLLNAFLIKNERRGCVFYLAGYNADRCGVLTLIANNSGARYMDHNTPLTYFVKRNKRVFLLTGIEKLFDVKKSNSEDSSKMGSFYDIESYVFYKGRYFHLSQGIPLFAPPPSNLIFKEKDVEEE